MGSYFLKRLLLLIPTLFGILVINFLIIHAAPGGPIEQILSRMHNVSEQGETFSKKPGPTKTTEASYEKAFIQQMEKQYGFDQPLGRRFWSMIKRYVVFDLGDSYFKGEKVWALIVQKLPTSLSLGLWSTLCIYLISIPLGIAKAYRHRQPFDLYTSVLITISYAIPGFLFALLLLIFFAGGHFWSWFPLRGLTSANWQDLSWLGKITDYFWHMALPLTAQVMGGFAAFTFLVKNSFLEEMRKSYVIATRAQGFSEKSLLWHHIFRNALLVLIAGLPSALLSTLLTGSVLIETIFSLDGIGLLGFEAVSTRDYPIVFGTVYIYTLFGLVLHLISDLLYGVIDPRIDFKKHRT